MQESNIRWGELIGGLLVMGCSVALIITFWKEITARPLLKFSLFHIITAGIFAVGLYTEHRWKLPTTSRAMLLIGALLVPLDFLAVTSQSDVAASALAVVAEVVAFGVLGWLLWLAARVLAPLCASPLTIAVMIGGVSHALISRFAGRASIPESQFILLALVPLAGYVAANLVAVGGAWRRGEIAATDSNSMFMMLLTSSFAAILPLAFLATRGNDWTNAVRQLAPVLSLGAIPSLGAGLFFWKQLRESALAGARTAWTAVAIVGASILIGTIALAWPQPGAMLCIALLAFAALTAAAVLFEMPAAHLPAMAALSMAYVLAFHLVLPWQRISWAGESSSHLLRSLTSASNGAGLLPLFVAVVALQELLLRKGRRSHAMYHAIAAAAIAVASLVLVSIYGLGQRDDRGTTWVYAAYSAGALLLSWRSGVWAGTWISMWLLGAAVVQGLVFRYPLPGDVAH